MNCYLYFFCSYFQKVPTEAPQLELKANYGLVEPVPFEFPPPSAHWTPEMLAAFDLTKRPKDDSVWDGLFPFIHKILGEFRLYSLMLFSK